MANAATPEGANGRDRLEFRGLVVAAKDLVTILLLLLVAAGGYLRYKSTDKHLEALSNQIIHLQDTMHVQSQANRTLLITHDFNDCKPPGDRLPLDLTPPDKR